MPVIGLLWITSDSPASYLDAFREGLKSLGYVEGRNIRLDDRFLVDRYDRLPGAAEKVAGEKVDVIFAYGTTATVAASKATSTIPVVTLVGADPVELGVAVSLSKPGKNFTGISSINPAMAGKRLELLKEAVPGIQRVGVVFSPDSRADLIYRQALEAAAKHLKLEVRSVELRQPEDIESSIAAVAKLGVAGIAFPGSTLFNAHQKRIIAAVAKTRLPAVYGAVGFVESGGLMSYSASQLETFRQVARYVDRILKGARPSDLPIEQPTKFELTVNLKTAKALGITIPQSILVRADRVIE